MKFWAPVLLLALLGTAPSASERREVLDALRRPIEAKLGQKVEFVVQVFRVEGSWAFIIADPQRKGGKPIDGWKVFGEHFDNMDGLRTEAVLRKKAGRWTVVDYGIGATDVWYCDVGPKALKRGYGC